MIRESKGKGVFQTNISVWGHSENNFNKLKEISS
jgi:hypothetical protein